MKSKPLAEHPALDKIVLLIVSGLGNEALRVACVEKLGVTKRNVAKIVKQARRRLTLAADYNRDEQLGTAITRLNDIYARAIRAGDIKTALTAQREINKLMDLYVARFGSIAADGNNDEPNEGGPRSELEAIRKHLLPLALAGKEYPLHEHARIAADLVREHRQRNPK